MASEDQDILAQISQLAGQINRVKNGQNPDLQSQQFRPPQRTNNTYEGYPQISTNWPARGGYRTRGYARGGRKPQLHRNRTLILNSLTPNHTPPNGVADENESPSADSTTSAPSFIVKTDRHRQLINTSVYEKESQQRVKAMELTRQQKLRQKDEREKMKLSKNLYRLANSYDSTAPRTPGGTFEIDVGGIPFRVTKSGSKLVKVPGEDSRLGVDHATGFDESVMDLRCSGDVNAPKSTPKTAVVGGVRFIRSKHGNLYRQGVVKTYRRNGAVKKINEPCKIFSTTGTCPRGPRCPYDHDPSKVAVCKEFLQKGVCPSGDQCDLSHDLTPSRTPSCLHFARGNCSNPSCRYTHVHVSPTAPVCSSFGFYGFCAKGASCTERHVSECPDFSNTGICKTKGCKLPHRLKASIMRNLQSGENSSEDQNSDVSSDEEEIDTDDVDSDDLDGEFFGDEDGNLDEDIPMQQDYVQFA